MSLFGKPPTEPAPESNSTSTVTPPPPLLSLHKVQICVPGGACILERVMAADCKSALLAVLDSLEYDHPAWQWPGWQVEVYPARDAFILKGGAL